MRSRPQVEVILFIHRHWLAEIWFIRDLDAPVKVRLAMGMEPKVLAPGEVAPQRVLYVVERGKVMFNGRILSRGMAWGDEIILSDKRYFLNCFARAIAYSDVTQLTQLTLESIVSAYPTSRLALRRMTVRLALRRHIVMLARERKLLLWQQQQQQGGAGEGEDGLQRDIASLSLSTAGDFMDRVQAAVGGSMMSDDQEASMNIALQLDKHMAYRSGDDSPTPQWRRAGQGGLGGGDDGGVSAGTLLTEVRGAMSEMRERVDRQVAQVKEEIAEMRKEARKGQAELAEQLAAGLQKLSQDK